MWNGVETPKDVEEEDAVGIDRRGGDSDSDSEMYYIEFAVGEFED